MNGDYPRLRDYVLLFQRYGDDLGSIYREPDDDRYALLFEQVVRLLTQASGFNASLPEPFRRSARRYRAGDPAMRTHFADPANRHFMLCDLHDLVMLRGGLGLKRDLGPR